MVAALVVVLVPIAIIAVPILTHDDRGLSGQGAVADDWPLTVTATGDDGRTRTLTVSSEDGPVDTAALTVGQHLVVEGDGYDGSRGIYVAVCKIPDAASVKPGPCVGGVPESDQQEIQEGAVQYAPSNWINDDWAWKLFGARSYDDVATGTFTAYLEVGDPGVCAATACGIFTRNDHTALGDRVQDLYLPVDFAG